MGGDAALGVFRLPPTGHTRSRTLRWHATGASGRLLGRGRFCPQDGHSPALARPARTDGGGQTGVEDRGGGRGHRAHTPHCCRATAGCEVSTGWLSADQRGSPQEGWSTDVIRPGSRSPLAAIVIPVEAAARQREVCLQPKTCRRQAKSCQIVICRGLACTRNSIETRRAPADAANEGPVGSRPLRSSKNQTGPGPDLDGWCAKCTQPRDGRQRFLMDALSAATAGDHSLQRDLEGGDCLKG